MNLWKLLQKNHESLRGSSGQARIMNQGDILSLLLENRGVKTRAEVEEFLNPKLESVTIENVGIDRKEVEKALDLIKKTIDEQKAIIIYGDYDVDGITGTAILWETIYKVYKQSLPLPASQSKSKNTHPYIPHRVDEGYGISVKGINNLKSEISNIGLIITVDNGIVAHRAIAYAQSLGMQVIVTDHHTSGKDEIKPDALIHTTKLCGASVAYLFSQEINKSFKLPQNDSHLELAALATVADLVPLNKHNKTLLKFGLEKLRITKRPGLVALFEEAKIQQKVKKYEIDTYHIGHIISPRLNASGRISHAFDSLRLICTTDSLRAGKLASLLGEINRQRQSLTFESALSAIEEVRKEKKLDNLILVQSEAYDQGVIGLVASRVVEEFYRPAIAVSVGKDISKGSARSIFGVNVIELIRSCSKYLTEAGGHPMAAGFSIKTKDLPAFKKAILKKAEEINPKLFEKELKIDLLIGFENITLELFESIQKLAPFGMGNPTPTFMTKNVNIVRLNTVGKNGDHLQILLEKDGYIFKAILFNHQKMESLLIGDRINIVYTIELNEWKEQKNLELKVRDLQL